MIFVFAGPSGAGKSTLLRAIRERDRRLMFSRSCTSRDPRSTDKPDEYDFRPRAEVQHLAVTGQLLEWAEVYGNLYGTPVSEIERAKSLGKDLVLDIDWQGAEQVMQADIGARFILVIPPSRQVLEERLSGRGDTVPSDMERRVRSAAEHLQKAYLFDAWIVNDDLERTVTTVEGLLSLMRMRVDFDVRRFRNTAVFDRILSTFLAQPA